ncbi:hypothetical protein ACFQNE_03245 [Gordonia phosphorivorans]|uniref:Uncharacterized protein n=1 Tax=Gordonia phosphorivorans TaxID=1056982 RepID=A0ABV6H469_9ACTN
MTANANVNVYGLFLPRAGERIVARCANLNIDAAADGPALLVMACPDGSDQLTAAAADWSDPSAASLARRGAGLVALRATVLTVPATDHPGRLLAYVADLSVHTRPLVWADLDDPGRADTGRHHRRAS